MLLLLFTPETSLTSHKGTERGYREKRRRKKIIVEKSL